MAVYVEPRTGNDPAGTKFVACSCGGSMSPERGTRFDEDGRLDLMWWRCDANPNHVTRSLPLPIQMARSC